MTSPTTPTPRKRSSWLRKLLYVFGGLVVLLVVAFFVVTSSAFIKGVILPRVGKAMGGEVTAGNVSLSPFSQLQLHQLKVQTTGTEPLLQAEDVRVRYNLFTILGGTIKVDEVTIASPVVQIVENADGTSNLDPLMKKDEKAPPKPSAPSTKPLQIDVKNFALKGATVRYTKIQKDGGRQVAELSGIDITLDQAKNGQASKLTTAANFKLTRPTNDVLEVKTSGHFEFSLGADLMPTSFQAHVDQDIVRAEGTFSELAGHRTTLVGNVTPTEVKEFSERFLAGDKLLGEVKVSGPLDLAKKEGRLKLEFASIDRQVLNLAGAPMGIDFGATTLDAVTEIALTQGGSVIAANTKFNAAKFSITQKGQTTPALDLQLAAGVTLKPNDKTAQLESLTIDGTQNQKTLVHGGLAQPMTIAWGGATAAAGDSAFDLAVTDFNFADWKMLLGDAVSAGRFSLKLNVLAQKGGQSIKLGLTSQIADLSAKLGATPLTQAAVNLKLDGQVDALKKINLSAYRLELTQQAQPALTVSGSATYDGAAFNLQTQIEAVMSRLTGSGPTTPLTAGVKLDGSFTNEVLDLRQLQLALAPTDRAAKNEVNVTGRVDLHPPITKGNLTVKSDTLDLTQLYNAFNGDKKPAASTTTTASATSQPAAASAGNVEPDPVTLPLQFAGDVNLGKVFLGEIAIQNCQMTAKVDGSKISVDPCKLTLNGAPVQATVGLDLGVKGYQYMLALKMDKVPLEPIANTFSPANKGKYQGLIIASAQIKGAGVTGAGLQKNLNGQADFSFTNANIQVTSPATKKLLVPIATLLRVGDITQSPLDWVAAQTDMGSGNINLRAVTIESPTFEARTHGVITLAEVLTNSPLNLPVDFALRRSLAEKSGLLPANTPPNANYATLPQFITVKGTIGDPKSDLNELALGDLLLKSGLGVANKLGVKIDPKAGDALQGLGNLLPGQKPAGTNLPGTNPAPKLNPLDLFNRKP